MGYTCCGGKGSASYAPSIASYTVSHNTSCVNYNDTVPNYESSKVLAPFTQKEVLFEIPSNLLYLSLPNEKNYDQHADYIRPFAPGKFLSRDRPAVPFVGDVEEVKDAIVETFEKATSCDFPSDLEIRIVSESELKKIHRDLSGTWEDGIQGFALNRVGTGMVSEIFVKQNSLDELMLTLGHEIGHVLSKPLPSLKDEEAKAFAFSLEWMKTIKEHNILELKNSINFVPAQNGLHNVAFDFVMDHIKEGKTPIDIFSEIVTGEISIT